MRELYPKAYAVQCFRTGEKVSFGECKNCKYYKLDGAVAAIGEYPMTYDTILDVQSPHLCLWEGGRE